MSARAPRTWRIVARFGRYYVENQYGGFAGWHDTVEDAERQLSEYLRENPEDSRA